LKHDPEGDAVSEVEPVVALFAHHA
jgi:hypothetical protein